MMPQAGSVGTGGLGHNVPMDTEQGRWALAGVAAGAAGTVASYAASMLLTIRDAPLMAFTDLLGAITPEEFVQRALGFLGAAGGPLLVLVVVLLLGGGFAWAGSLRRTHWWAPLPLWLGLSAAGAGATLVGAEHVGLVDLVPFGIGVATAVVLMEVLAQVLERSRLREESVVPGRRGFLIAVAVVGVGSVALAAVSRVLGADRRHVAEMRRLLRLEGLTRGRPPALADLGVAGVAPWQTPNEDFYVYHQTFAIPAVEPDEWWLRIHGRVDQEVRLSYRQLVSRPLTESWITLAGVRNEVGGDEIGNAWWSGVLLADLLAEAGVQAGADCVLQTGADGWSCATPLSALTDARGALLAVGMNGRPLPIEHGFPARTVVPGLFGRVSAAKWVVDLEVARYDELGDRLPRDGWADRAPVKPSARIDVPVNGADVEPGALVVGGLAWAPGEGVARVEVALDGGAWDVATIGDAPGPDTWVQWTHEFEVAAGEHLLVARVIDHAGAVQTSVRTEPKPDGATGWHTVEFSVVQPED